MFFTPEEMASIFFVFSDSRFMNSPCGLFLPYRQKEQIIRAGNNCWVHVFLFVRPKR